MKRLVYSPEVNVWVKTDTGIFDLSPYVTDFSVNRKVNSASGASVSFRNPKVEDDNGQLRFLFTQHPVKQSDGSTTYGPMFHPMDPIIITLTRLKGHPVQVFTGYCDQVPYVQLFPGTTSLTASCTLKRLKYTYWDPGLVFVNEYMASKGWIPTTSGVTLNAPVEASKGTTLNDATIGRLIYDILVDVGGWAHDDIYIQELPSDGISKVVNGIYQDLVGDSKASWETFRNFLTEVVGTSSIGGGMGDSGGSLQATNSSGGKGWVRVGATTYDDAGGGASGKLGQVKGNFAELGTASSKTGNGTGFGWLAKAFGQKGELPLMTKLEIRYKGKVITAYKTDRGYGQGGDGYTSDSTYAIDLWTDATKALNFPGKDFVEVRKV
jgi:hypothetical protein